MQAIAESRAASGLPAPMDLRVEREFRVLAMKLDPGLSPAETIYTLAAIDAPAPEVRQALEVRRAQVIGWIAPAGPVIALEQYSRHKEVMAHRESATSEGAEIRTKAYVADWAGIPHFALALTCRDFRRGALGDGKWLPEPGLVRAEALRRCADLAKERRELDAVLTATIRPAPIDPTRKALLLEAARGWIGGVKASEANAKRGRMTDKEIADAKALSEAMATGRDTRPMPPLSPELRRSLGLPDLDMVPDGAANAEDAA